MVLKNAEEEEAEKEHQEHTKVEGNFTSLEYKTALKGVFKSIWFLDFQILKLISLC